VPEAISYSEAAHCALIVLRCAKNAHPINSVLDEDYRLEVEMLRPGTKLPHPMTIQWDLLCIYDHTSIAIKDYFLYVDSYLENLESAYILNIAIKQHHSSCS